MAIKVDPDWWKDLFDEVYLLTDARSVCDNETTGREVDLLQNLLPLGVEDRILDLCGGHGRHCLELGRRGYMGCTVLDYSSCLIEKGKEAAAEENLPVEFLQGDATSTGLDGGTFDHMLILGNSLGYQDSDDGDFRIASEARRLLRAGGCLLVDTVDGDAVRERFMANAWHEIGGDIVVCREREIDASRIRAREIVMSRTKGLIRENRYAIRLYRQEELSALFERAGFEEVSLCCGPPSAGGGRPWLHGSSRLFDSSQERDVDPVGIFLAVLLALFCIVGIALVPLGLPGTFVICGAAVLYGLATDFVDITTGTIVLLLAASLLAEAIEALAGIAGAKRYGSGNWAVAASIVGGVAGAVIGAPILFGIGSIPGALAGAFAAAVTVELIGGKSSREAVRAGWGTFVGRLAGTVVKGVVAIAMTIICIQRIF